MVVGETKPRILKHKEAVINNHLNLLTMLLTKRKVAAGVQTRTHKMLTITATAEASGAIPIVIAKTKVVVVVEVAGELSLYHFQV